MIDLPFVKTVMPLPVKAISFQVRILIISDQVHPADLSRRRNLHPDRVQQSQGVPLFGHCDRSPVRNMNRVIIDTEDHSVDQVLGPEMSGCVHLKGKGVSGAGLQDG